MGDIHTPRENPLDDAFWCDALTGRGDPDPKLLDTLQQVSQAAAAALGSRGLKAADFEEPLPV